MGYAPLRDQSRPYPDPKETLVLLDLAADAGPDEKTRLFQTGVAWYVCAPGLHQPDKTTLDTLYPILLTIAGSANYRAARRSWSPADCIAKRGIVEEADECLYWMALLIASGLVPEARVQALYDEGNQILAIIISSIRTARTRQP